MCYHCWSYKDLYIQHGCRPPKMDGGLAEDVYCTSLYTHPLPLPHVYRPSVVLAYPWWYPSVFRESHPSKSKGMITLSQIGIKSIHRSKSHYMNKSEIHTATADLPSLADDRSENMLHQTKLHKHKSEYPKSHCHVLFPLQCVKVCCSGYGTNQTNSGYDTTRSLVTTRSVVGGMAPQSTATMTHEKSHWTETQYQ